jgi:transcriptional regulator with XRE-family HTH domain
MITLNALRLARLKAGKTQCEAAIETGIPQSVLSLLERGFKEPTDKHLAALAWCYSTDVETLRTGDSA